MADNKYRGNKGLEYYRAYPRDFFEGTIGMTGQLRGFYRMVLDLIYMHDGYLLNDWGHIAGNTGYGKTQCKRMINQLVEMEKLQLSGKNDEFFTQKRAKNELKHSKKFQENQSKKAAKRWENNDLVNLVGDATGMPPQYHNTTRLKRKPTVSQKTENLDLFADQKKTNQNNEISDAIKIFSEVAKKHKLPIPRKITEARKKSLKARLFDAGGIEGWEIACQKLDASNFLTGQNVRGWKADFNFMLRESSFTKLMEGCYDNRDHGKNGRTQNPGGIHSSATPEEIADRATRLTAKIEAKRSGDSDTRNFIF